ncbi:MAG: hypothetical protein R3B70_01500 [Polyangiaceae bacterium]
MIRARNTLLGLLLGGALFATAGAAHADGLALSAGELPAEAKKTLTRDIAAHKASHPDDFKPVRDVQGVKPEVYKTFRNPQPIAVLELKRLGAGALLPMLDALALDAPALTLTEKEKTAYVVGLLEASSSLRDKRGAPIYTAIFEGKTKNADILRAAAEAMGRLCGDAELASLKKHTAATDALRPHALRGLSQCRRKESAEHLATLLASADAASAPPIADALGLAASSWAWKAMGKSQAAAAKDVQSIAAKALVASFVKHKDARPSAQKALLLVASPDSTALLQGARPAADAPTRVAIDTLVKLLTPAKK